VAELVRALNHTAIEHPALHLGDGDPGAFSWLDVDNGDQCTLAFERHEPGGGVVVCVANLDGRDHHGYRLGLCRGGAWRAILTTDDTAFGGHGGWADDLVAEDMPWQGRRHSAELLLPARSVTYLAPV
jgi:1,4-alpha-glucan branching enzyme